MSFKELTTTNQNYLYSTFNRLYYVFLFLVLILLFFSIHHSSANAAQATLIWDDHNNPGIVSGYLVYCGDSSRDYNTVYYVRGQTSFDFTDLTEGQDYFFAVKSVAYTGLESEFSDELFYSVPIDNMGTDSETLTENTYVDFSLEAGDVEVNHEWTHVDFKKSFIDPVVIAKSMTTNGNDPAVIRIRNVSNIGFDIRVQEWDYLDGYHTYESISYIAVESGTHILPDGTIIEADYFRASDQNIVSFAQSFTEMPIVFTSITSHNDAKAVTGRISNVTLNGYNYQLQEQELNSVGHGYETIDYIAWEPSSGIVDGYSFEVGKTGDEVTDDTSLVTFLRHFNDAPVFLADIQTINESDTASLRMGLKDSEVVEIKITEEKSWDSETDHAPEVVGFISLLPYHRSSWFTFTGAIVN